MGASRPAAIVVTLVASLVALATAGGCSAPAAIPRDDLALGNDDANAAKKKNGATDSPEGRQMPGTELGTGTPGTEPATEPPRADGDGEGDSSAPATCTMDAQCNQTGRICAGGTCVKGCRNDLGCPTNESCKQGQCGLTNASVECTFDYDCELGTICVAGACKPGCYASFDCPTGQVCTSGACKVSSVTPPPSGGTPCSSDGQCNPGVNGAGKICSAQGVCVDGCHRDNQCPGTKICVTGMCK